MVAATFSCIISQNSKVLWVPQADCHAEDSGQWVSADQACFVSGSSDKPSATVANVARRAGVLLVEAPVALYQVGMPFEHGLCNVDKVSSPLFNGRMEGARTVETSQLSSL